MTELALRSDASALSLWRELEDAGAITPTHLDLSDYPALSYSTCESLAAFFGHIGNAYKWYLGDLVIYSEMVHGEAVGQIADASGLATRTIENITSIGRRIPPSVRRPNIDFYVQAEVAVLHERPDLQAKWLDEAEEKQLTKMELRSRVQGVKQDDGSEVITPAVTLQEAARAVWHASTRIVGDSFIVPAEVMLVLREVLGE